MAVGQHFKGQVRANVKFLDPQRAVDGVIREHFTEGHSCSIPVREGVFIVGNFKPQPTFETERDEPEVALGESWQVTRYDFILLGVCAVAAKLPEAAALVTNAAVTEAMPIFSVPIGHQDQASGGSVG